MIAGKENHQDRIAREIRERVSFFVGRRQAKFRRSIANLQSEAHDPSTTGLNRLGVKNHFARPG